MPTRPRFKILGHSDFGTHRFHLTGKSLRETGRVLKERKSRSGLGQKRCGFLFFFAVVRCASNTNQRCFSCGKNPWSSVGPKRSVWFSFFFVFVRRRVDRFSTLVADQSTTTSLSRARGTVLSLRLRFGSFFVSCHATKCSRHRRFPPLMGNRRTLTPSDRKWNCGV